MSDLVADDRILWRGIEILRADAGRTDVRAYTTLVNGRSRVTVVRKDGKWFAILKVGGLTLGKVKKRADHRESPLAALDLALSGMHERLAELTLRAVEDFGR